MKKILILIISLHTLLFAQNGPEAYFIFNPVCLGSSINCTDFSSPDPITNSPIISWDWVYNGNTIATTQNIDYLFNACGTYDITLIITDTDGIQDDTTFNVEIFCPPTAAFFNDIVCQGDPTSFVDVSTPGDGTPPLNSGSSWMYIFGNAAPPSAVNPNCTTVFNNSGPNEVIFIVSELQWNGIYCIDSLVDYVQVDSCFTGIENTYLNPKRKIMKNLDLLGKPKKINSKNLNIILYDDGIIEKKYIIE